MGNHREDRYDYRVFRPIKPDRLLAAVLFLIRLWPLAHFLLPTDPNLSAADVDALYNSNTTGIRRAVKRDAAQDPRPGYTNPACRRADSERAQRRLYS